MTKFYLNRESAKPIDDNAKKAFDFAIDIGNDILISKGKPAFVFVEEFFVKLAKKFNVRSEKLFASAHCRASAKSRFSIRDRIPRPVLAVAVTGEDGTQSGFELSESDFDDSYFSGALLPFKTRFYEKDCADINSRITAGDREAEEEYAKNMLARYAAIPPIISCDQDCTVVKSAMAAEFYTRNWLSKWSRREMGRNFILNCLALAACDSRYDVGKLELDDIDIFVSREALLRAIVTHSIQESGGEIYVGANGWRVKFVPVSKSRFLREFNSVIIYIDSFKSHLFGEARIWTKVVARDGINIWSREKTVINIPLTIALGGDVDITAEEAEELDERYRSGEVHRFVSGFYTKIADIITASYKAAHENSAIQEPLEKTDDSSDG